MKTLCKVIISYWSSKFRSKKALLFMVIIIFFSHVNLIKAQTIYFGDSVSIGNGQAKTWIEYDSDNIPLRIGLTLTEDALSGLPSFTRQMSLNLPEVSVDSLFKHILFDWNPNGHGPQSIYGIPHFDFHYYIIPERERNLIQGGSDNTPIASKYLPEDYFNGDNYESVPSMGVHYADSKAPEWNTYPFTKTLIYGYTKGEMIFVEPMITREYLLAHPTETNIIKQPEDFQRDGYYPTSYQIKFDKSRKVFDIVITDFLLHIDETTSTYETEKPNPKRFTLLQNYPNPFNPTTNIQFSIASRQFVELKIFNVLGQEIQTMVNAEKPAGNYQVEFHAANLPSGVYFYRIQAGDFVETKKMILMK